jgi:PIN domain nuclease of toxin-antitoxin system
MMRAVTADTHAAIWFMEDDRRLSPAAAAAMEGADLIMLPSIALVEIIYLIEKNRLKPEVLTRVVGELSNPATTLTIASLDLGIALALKTISREAVPDMPDRIMAATAVHNRVPLVTRDKNLRSCGIETIW